MAILVCLAFFEKKFGGFVQFKIFAHLCQNFHFCPIFQFVNIFPIFNFVRFLILLVLSAFSFVHFSILSHFKYFSKNRLKCKQTFTNLPTFYCQIVDLPEFFNFLILNQFLSTKSKNRSNSKNGPEFKKKNILYFRSKLQVEITVKEPSK